ncbi:MAG: patatin-like phospholipase family protein [Burkholderiales bacterium]|uniref:Patatin-like phospholipase family protein n=1 Tax=Ottowia pentelensis TaxID=511108 RepID=A0ABV6PT89_9BURK|nr:patatin-like phospholipase family protein [Ottowia sp.]MBN9405746.1 patatin-like phospholipase family protein [Burkholderiales bacterium]MBS0402491.1 patatin-like phospholipase family protein [Pseudomonadota bacterium]MBS0413057.1 patatin-like phospholipase family protein [Pseudomonadota bacterium]HMN57844.1 patatin-like phospholipase family protein [Ottowia sp.]
MPEAARTGAAKAGEAPRSVDLALQGGGSHGAFTWGVLDALLEDGRIVPDGVSGTSAGAMNAVVLAHGLARARHDGLKGQDVHEAGRKALKRFWENVGLLGNFSTGLPLPAAQAVASWFSQWISPAQANPLGVNPLRRLLLDQVDFELLDTPQAMKVFVCATNVRTGVGEVFSGKRLTVDAVMASACLPTMFKPVEIEGELYWDGGYSGNPALYPLIYNTRSNDVVLVQINPVAVPFKADANAQDIMERVNEITFNAPLLAEFRAIEFVARLLDEGRLDPGRYKKMLLHRVDGGAALHGYGSASKMRADIVFLHQLFEIGRRMGQRWIKTHFRNLGVRGTAIDSP